MFALGTAQGAGSHLEDFHLGCFCFVCDSLDSKVTQCLIISPIKICRDVLCVLKFF